MVIKIPWLRKGGGGFILSRLVHLVRCKSVHQVADSRQYGAPVTIDN